MHPSNIRYFLGIALPEPENAFFAELKILYHPEKTLSSPPHITLKPPFLMPNRSYMLEKLAKVARYQGPFELVFDKIGSFKQLKHGTVFLEPEASEKLKQIEIAVSTEIHYLPKTRNFHPHLTLAQRVPHDQLAQVKSELRDLNLKLKLNIQSLTLFQQAESGQWLPEKEFRFGELNTHPAHSSRRYQTSSDDDDSRETH